MKKQIKEETSIVLPDEATTTITIKTAEDMPRAVSILSVLNKALDNLQADREKITKPINAALKEVRAKYKPFETKLENKIAEIRGEMISFQTKQVQIQAKKESDLAEKVASEKISIESAADKLNALPEVINNTEVAEGSVKFREVKCFEVQDLSLIPIEFHLPNEVKIRAAMTAGTQLPGVRYFSEMRPFNSR